MAMKTPGVYIVEKNAFPNSVVEVATAVPAFIGYTERAVNGGRSLLNQPWRISSMNEYIAYFGNKAPPKFALTLEAAPPPPAAAGSPAAAPPTPPAVDDRAARAQTTVFECNGKKYKLTRAAGVDGGRYLMYQAMQHFFANGGAACYIVSVGDHDDAIDKDKLMAGIKTLEKEQEPTMVLTPDAVLLDQPGCTAVQQESLLHCGAVMKNRFAVLDVWGGDRPAQDSLFASFNCIETFRGAIGVNQLNFGAAYYPWLKTSLVGAGDLDFSVLGSTTATLTALADLLRNDLGITAANKATDPRRAALDDYLSDLSKDEDGWITKIKDLIAADTKKTPPEIKAAQDEVDAAITTPASKTAYIKPYKEQMHKALTAMSDLYAQALKEAREQMNLMPPSAAMAGLYTMVDNARGVWKAPANVSVNAVTAPSVEITHAAQEDLNVHTSGKSINAIRSFINEGALVWGARTLDGNSLDWRYINVRRTMIMLEESCRLAAKAMVFEPNVANTWVTIKSMITNFLTGIWKRGGLAGAVPDDAFSVHVGLGDTMTPEDILEGILRVTVLVAITRPAEFIEITFQQQMQKS